MGGLLLHSSTNMDCKRGGCDLPTIGISTRVLGNSAGFSDYGYSEADLFDEMLIGAKLTPSMGMEIPGIWEWI
ncbi:hypothetical protein SLA2020_515270 [Shorea laevis]